MSELSPMMQNYLATKEEYPGCILFYRLGDFYEMFFEDAKLVSKELELTLTGKACGLPERAPMCGVPCHAAESYVNRLVARGYKVAICEQVEDPKQARGLVKREVIRIVTPGTNLDPGGLDETRNNYVMCVCYLDGAYGIALADVGTADFLVTELEGQRQFLDELGKFTPAEIICNEEFLQSPANEGDLARQTGIPLSSLDAWTFADEEVNRTLTDHFHVSTTDGLGLSACPRGRLAAGALLRYLYDTQMTSLSHISRLEVYASSKYMILDSFTRRNLELMETMREKEKRGSLLWVLDKTKTAMGARLLRSFIEQPLLQKSDINDRLDAVSELYQNMITREELREYLNPVYDLERLIARIVYQTANPRDLIAFKQSLSMLPHIRQLLADLEAPLLRQVYEGLDPLSDLADQIQAAINEEPPITVREAGIIKDGYHEEVDRLRAAGSKGREWLAAIEEEEREKTGIKNLRIKYNKVFGYYLEVTNSFKDLVPDYFIRKQTLTNAERYITPELKSLEEEILGASDRLNILEYDLFCELRSRIADQVVRIQKTAKAVALLDVIACLAHVAERNAYVRPQIADNGSIRISEGRHPVVEKMMKNDLFIPNDTYLDQKKDRVAIITGPNMAGKSTYMRQNALIVLMAQIGSFVPAKKASIGIVDRIFTRVGASDDLASGQSTFMVEMTEVANILRNASKNSLLILDEIGRGTSTIDGLSIARAVVEYISDPGILGAKTLFATHYHELTELEGKLSNVKNYCIAVKERGDDIVFLRKIIPGGADKSFGIQVAKIAGVPDAVINRAKEISDLLSAQDAMRTLPDVEAAPAPSAVRSEASRKDQAVIAELKDIDVQTITPIEALNKLYDLHSKACASD